MKNQVKDFFGIVDYIIFFLMLAISGGIGLYYGYAYRKKNNTQEFLMGGRSLSVFPVGISVLVSSVSAILLLGNSAEVYRFGTQYMMINVALCFVIPITAYLYLPVFFNLGVTSAYEYLELRFNRFVRTVGAMVFWLQSIAIMPILLYAPSLAFAEVSGVNLWFCVLSVGLVCTFYTSIGGMRAVVLTDLFQSILMYASILLIIIKGTSHVGGLDVVWNRALVGKRIEFFNFSLSPTVRHTFWSLVIGGTILWVSFYAVSQQTVQRYLSVATLEKSQWCIWINFPAFVFLHLICCFAGLVIYAFYFECDPIGTQIIDAPDQLLPRFVMETLYEFPGIPGLFISGLFSGAISSISSTLNSLAAVTLEDVIKMYITKDLSELCEIRIAKFLALVYGLVMIALVLVAERLGGVLQATIAISGTLSGPMLGLFTVGMFFPWSSSIGATTGVFSGFILSVYICLGAFFYKPFNPETPRSYASCADLFHNVTGIIATEPVYILPSAYDDEIPSIFRISYLWICSVGFITTVTIGAVTSLIPGCRGKKHVEAKLLSPLVLWTKKLFMKNTGAGSETNENKDITVTYL